MLIIANNTIALTDTKGIAFLFFSHDKKFYPRCVRVSASCGKAASVLLFAGLRWPPLCRYPICKSNPNRIR
jgi:hypothetical protein